MNPSWPREAAKAVTTSEALAAAGIPAPSGTDAVLARYPMRITPYFAGLARKSAGIAAQVLPDKAELSDALPLDDPLHETAQSPVPGLIHRYPDRVLFLVSGQCAVYCRYCMRKRLVGKTDAVTNASRKAAINYIAKTPAVKDVILSGGDPLMLATDFLEDILDRLSNIPHIDIVRIHTRTPGVLPGRITPHLAAMLSAFKNLYVNIQFNHPDEITKEVKAACATLADAGLPLGSQTVLLKGVNDDPDTLLSLMRKLLAIRVKPYYLHHPDVVKGTGHFRIPVEKGLGILSQLYGKISGMGIPRYVIDLPGGGGKVALVPDAVQGLADGNLKVTGLGGRIYSYPE